MAAAAREERGWLDGVACAPELRVFTVGFGALDREQLLELLHHYGIHQVVDVRGAASSPNNPQFDKKVLSPFLRIRRIKYLHLKELGGIRRHVRKSSENAGWRNASLRGFADYMRTPPFKVAVNRLLTIAQARVTALLCAEASPARCHRLLIADALTVRGVSVTHIYSESRRVDHTLSAMASVAGTEITYPAAGSAVTEGAG